MNWNANLSFKTTQGILSLDDLNEIYGSGGSLCDIGIEQVTVDRNEVVRPNFLVRLEKKNAQREYEKLLVGGGSINHAFDASFIKPDPEARKVMSMGINLVMACLGGFLLFYYIGSLVQDDGFVWGIIGLTGTLLLEAWIIMLRIEDFNG